MKKLSLIMIALSFAIALNAGITENKIYLEPEQVKIEKGNIYVNILGVLLPASGLHADLQGLHVFATEIIDQNTFSNTCPFGHYSPDASGMCNRDGCPFQKK